jgi:hypothetical protein
LRRLLAALTLWVAFAGTALASLITGASSAGNLYLITPTTGTTTLIGAMGVTMYDIAEYNGKLYGINGTGSLYSINTTTGVATLIGATGQSFNALTFSSTGVLYATGPNTTNLYTINTTTGAATRVTNGSNPAYNTAGDLQFIGNTLYMTVGTNASSLVRVNTTTGALTTVGAIGFNMVYGLAVSNGTLYGFTDPGVGQQPRVITINTTTGVGTLVTTYGPAGFGFYGTTDDPFVPEPSTMLLTGAGLIALAAIRRRRLSRKPQDGSPSGQS